MCSFARTATAPGPLGVFHLEHMSVVGTDGVRASPRDRTRSNQLLHTAGTSRERHGVTKTGPQRAGGRPDSGQWSMVASQWSVVKMVSGRTFWVRSGSSLPYFSPSHHKRPRAVTRDSKRQRSSLPRHCLTTLPVSRCLFPALSTSSLRRHSLLSSTASLISYLPLQSRPVPPAPSRQSRLSRPESSRFHDPALSTICGW